MVPCSALKDRIRVGLGGATVLGPQLLGFTVHSGYYHPNALEHLPHWKVG